MNQVKIKDKVLVVDDDEAKLYSITRYLSIAGFEVLTAKNGKETFEQLKESPDLIILDVNLPDISGYDLCHKIKELYHDEFLPIIHISATFTESRHQAYGLEVGADAYLPEPIDRQVLIATIKAFIRLRKAEQKIRILACEFTTLAEKSPDIICKYSYTSELKLDYISSAVTKILGYGPEEFYNKPELVSEIVVADDRELIDNFLNPKSDSGKTIIRVTHKNGQIIYLEVNKTILRNGKGDIEGILFIARDMTEHIQKIQEIEAILNKENQESKQNFLSICAGCKKIKKDQEWVEIDNYLRENFQFQFSHGICPKCLENLYPQFSNKRGKHGE